MRTAHELEARNHALKTLLAAAYDLSPQAISCVPDWGEADHYDIVGKAPGEPRPTLDPQMAMLRRLLNERFHLVCHREPRGMAIYSLTVANGGPKLREPATPADAMPQGPPALAFVISWGSQIAGAKRDGRRIRFGAAASGAHSARDRSNRESPGATISIWSFFRMKVSLGARSGRANPTIRRRICSQPSRNSLD